jgi:hypothetical protein
MIHLAGFSKTQTCYAVSCHQVQDAFAQELDLYMEFR